MAAVIENPESPPATTEAPAPKKAPRKPRKEAEGQQASQADSSSNTATSTSAPAEKAPSGADAAASKRPAESRNRRPNGENFEPWYVKREKERLRRMESKSMPFRKSTITLNTRHAQEAYDRANEMWVEAMITLSVTMRSFKPENECIIVDQEVDRIMDACDLALQTQKKRLAAVAESNGIDLDSDGDVEYTHPMKYDLHISSPRERRFHNALRELDKVCTYLDLLWMMQLIKDRDRALAAYEMKSVILRTCGRARNLVFRAQGSSQRNGVKRVDDPRKGTQLDASPKVDNAGFTAEAANTEGHPEPQAVTPELAAA